MGAPPFVARSQVVYAEMLAAHGDAAALRNARGLAETALAASQELGMTPWMLRAKAVLDTCKAKGLAAHPLSRRELEVAVLVPEGISNRALAERLHLSEQAAESPVNNICDQLEFRPR